MDAWDRAENALAEALRTKQTPETFAATMRALDDGDTECRHSRGDDLMCKVLTGLGYGEGVEIWKSWDKWWA